MEMLVIRLAIRGNAAARPLFSTSLQLNSSSCSYTSSTVAVQAERTIREGPGTIGLETRLSPSTIPLLSISSSMA
ncbi:hypothetical protein CDL15_Pgr016854 [Punica granatum]|nr:hypothetical protein CDL15_Pgr016854 [Punica granatum]